MVQTQGETSLQATEVQFQTPHERFMRYVSSNSQLSIILAGDSVLVGVPGTDYEGFHNNSGNGKPAVVRDLIVPGSIDFEALEQGVRDDARYLAAVKSLFDDVIYELTSTAPNTGSRRNSGPLDFKASYGSLYRFSQTQTSAALEKILLGINVPTK